MLMDYVSKDIRFERSRNFVTLAPEAGSFSCPDLPIVGEIPAYHRWADFLWNQLTQRALPLGLDRKVLREEWLQGPYLEDTDYELATLTQLDVNENGGDASFVLTKKTISGSTTYHVFFKINVFDYASYYGFILDHAHAEVIANGVRRNYTLQRMDLREEELYEDISEIVYALAQAGISINYRGTAEEEASVSYLTPNASLYEICSEVTWENRQVTMTYSLPDGSLQGKVTGELWEVFGQEREDIE